LDQVPAKADVLDVGCAGGHIGEQLVRRGCRVWGVDRDPEIGAAARAYRDVARIDLDTATALPWDCTFDLIIAADVLEHLLNPVAALTLLRRHLRPTGQLLVSLPNVAHVTTRVSLLAGRFDYAVGGILDRTHLHLYTFASGKRLLREGGFEVTGTRCASRRFGRTLNRRPILRKAFGGLLSYNIVLLGGIPNASTQ
jgi:2-polyprenyl-3-methyl-5-hydroxy-6-metoxy-1,4-benzoquinol methylase